MKYLNKVFVFVRVSAQPLPCPRAIIHSRVASAACPCRRRVFSFARVTSWGHRIECAGHDEVTSWMKLHMSFVVCANSWQARLLRRQGHDFAQQCVWWIAPHQANLVELFDAYLLFFVFSLLSAPAYRSEARAFSLASVLPACK